MEHHEELLGLLKSAVKGCGDESRAVAFSGGLDSSVVALLAAEMGAVALYTVGIDGSDDLKHAKITTEEMGLPFHPLIITESDIVSAVPEVIKAVGTDPVVVSFELPLYFVAKNAPEETILVGQGADELFGGYARYSKMGESGAEERIRADVQSLIESGISRDRNVAALFGKELCCPFLDRSVVEFSLKIPIAEKITETEKKAVLRKAARLAGLALPAERPKKAAQYGSGIMKVMKKRARKEGLCVGEWVGSLRDR